MRRFFVGGNWKCNGKTEFIDNLVKGFNEASFEGLDVEVLCAPPYVYLGQVLRDLRKDWHVGAQDSHLKEGAFTSAVSAEMLADIGLKWTIIGHSERRDVFKDTNEIIAQKTLHALESGLNVVLCCGEHLEDREAGKTEDVVFAQIDACVKILKPEHWDKVVIAYEPVWAIGTGVTATPDQAQEVHAKLRAWLTEHVSKDVADAMRIIYGGSVNAKNCAELGHKADVDGFLVGGASLKVADFVTIVSAQK